jgi:superfamily II DNA or RNA helicase
MLKLRPYQEKLLEDLRQSMRQGHRRILAVMPTGAGKGTTIAVMVQSAADRGKRVLILAHRKELIADLSKRISWLGIDHGIICAGYSEDLTKPVQVGSVQTIVRRIDRIPEPSLIVQDEAHHLIRGNMWGRIVDAWPDAYLIGKTATPARLGGEGLGEGHGGYFTDMVLGPSVADLIFTGYLSPARIYAPPVVADLQGIRSRGGDYANDQAAAAMDRPTVTGDAIAHYQRLAAGQQAIAFCCNVAHAVSVCDAFKTAGISAELLLGNTSGREQVVADFAAHRIRVLVTVDVVSEGFDVPAASCAILLRPTQSLGLYLQQVGRVLRPAAGKNAAIILDHVGNVHRHGFPDDHRDWSLDDRLRTGRGGTGQPAPSVRTCTTCFAAFKPAPVCPCCGAACAPEKRRDVLQIDGELLELKREEIRQRAAERKQQRVRARTLSELLAVARIRGYDPGWAYRVHNARSSRA